MSQIEVTPPALETSVLQAYRCARIRERGFRSLDQSCDSFAGEMGEYGGIQPRPLKVIRVANLKEKPGQEILQWNRPAGHHEMMK